MDAIVQKNPEKTEAAMLTADQAHEMAGGAEVISRASWYAALGRREIPCVRVGRRILVPRRAFMAFLEGREQNGSHQAA
jgi:hypothetical protein